MLCGLLCWLVIFCCGLGRPSEPAWGSVYSAKLTSKMLGTVLPEATSADNLLIDTEEDNLAQTRSMFIRAARLCSWLYLSPPCISCYRYAGRLPISRRQVLAIIMNKFRAQARLLVACTACMRTVPHVADSMRLWQEGLMCALPSLLGSNVLSEADTSQSGSGFPSGSRCNVIRYA